MVHELTKNFYLMWEIDKPTVLIEPSTKFITFTQHSDIIEISVDQIDELIKLLKIIKKEKYAGK